ncbi:MAG TPA: hypothetical protein VKS98_08345, partial [Chthoniobacterales bacterium]|nr:hypothetical protein [Chthoniobacterales bacterium]
MGYPAVIHRRSCSSRKLDSFGLFMRANRAKGIRACLSNPLVFQTFCATSVRDMERTRCIDFKTLRTAKGFLSAD